MICADRIPTRHGFGNGGFYSFDLLENIVGCFIVEPIDASTTRLNVRGRSAVGRSWLEAAFDRAIFEPMHFVMERQMMIGIRDLAEGRTAAVFQALTFLQPPVLVGEVLTGLAITVLVWPGSDPTRIARAGHRAAEHPQPDGASRTRFGNSSGAIGGAPRQDPLEQASAPG